MKGAALAGIALIVAVVVVVAILRPAGDSDRVAEGRPIERLPPNGVAVPLSIASDCSQNVERELTSFLASVPDGSNVWFPRDRATPRRVASRFATSAT